MSLLQSAPSLSHAGAVTAKERSWAVQGAGLSARTDPWRLGLGQAWAAVGTEWLVTTP